VRRREGRRPNIDGKVSVIAPVGDRIATNISFVQVCADMNLTSGPAQDAQAMTFGFKCDLLPVEQPPKFALAIKSH
jgi:hypothetical protein